MNTPSLRRKILILLLASAVTTPLSAATGPRQESPRPAKTVEAAPLDLLSRAWSFLRSSWSKEGCHIDPSGLCLNTPAQPPTNQAEEGCKIDPSGLCHS